LRSGKVKKIDDIKFSPRFRALDSLCKIYGVGPSTARDWLAKGFENPDEVWEAFERGEVSLTKSQEMGLRFREEFDKPMTRADAEEIAQLVRKAMNAVDPQIQMELCGSYRREKEENGDLDVIFTHPDPEMIPGLMGKVVESLRKLGNVAGVFLYKNCSKSLGSRSSQLVCETLESIDTLKRMVARRRKEGLRCFSSFVHCCCKPIAFI
jgi:DNA polymerase IV